MPEGGSSQATETGGAKSAVTAQVLPVVESGLASNGGGQATQINNGQLTQSGGPPVTHASPREHVTLWLLGVLLASLIPLLFIEIHGIDEGAPPSLFKLLGHGDLLLISLVVTVAAITELILATRSLKGNRQHTAGNVAVMSGILAIAAEAMWYADLSSKILDGKSITTTHAVTYGSLTLFVISAFCSAVCVWLAAGAP